MYSTTSMILFHTLKIDSLEHPCPLVSAYSKLCSFLHVFFMSHTSDCCISHTLTFPFYPSDRINDLCCAYITRETAYDAVIASQNKKIQVLQDVNPVMEFSLDGAVNEIHVSKSVCVCS